MFIDAQRVLDSKSRMRDICTSGSVGALGEQSPGATRPSAFPSHGDKNSRVAGIARGDRKIVPVTQGAVYYPADAFPRATRSTPNIPMNIHTALRAADG